MRNLQIAVSIGGALGIFLSSVAYFRPPESKGLRLLSRVVAVLNLIGVSAGMVGIYLWASIGNENLGKWLYYPGMGLAGTTGFVLAIIFSVSEHAKPNK